MPLRRQAGDELLVGVTLGAAQTVVDVGKNEPRRPNEPRQRVRQRDAIGAAGNGNNARAAREALGAEKASDVCDKVHGAPSVFPACGLAAIYYPPPTRKRRSASTGSAARINVSPTRTAFTPAVCSRTRSSQVRMPLSLTRQQSAGTPPANSNVCSSRVTKVRRSRLLTPISRAPLASTRDRFSRSYTSTSACIPSA